MGEGTVGLNGGGAEPTPRDLEREIDEIRDELGGLVGELDRRRHDVLDWRLQLRRHRREMRLVLGAALALAIGGVALRRALRRRRERPVAHARSLLRALELAAREPEAFERAIDAQRARPARTAANVATAAGGALLRAGASRLARSA
jgi:hypothetical protein